MSTEQAIIKKYQPVIRALIPYQQQGKLLEGLNRFSAKLNAQARQVIKNEVIRLTSQSTASADNSAFAQFPVKRFSHFGVEMALDKVGEAILKKETTRYMERYTVGVFESLTSSEHYQNLVQRQRRERIIKAFTVQSQSYRDMDFKDDIAITPNFSVSTSAYQNGRSMAVVTLSVSTICVACTRSPSFTPNTGIPIVFPAIAGLCKASQTIHYDLSGIEFNKLTQRYHATLQLSDLSIDWQSTIRGYLNRVMLRYPLARDLEIERAMQALDRDRIVQHSPWLPIFLEQTKRDFKPVMVMQTEVNCEHKPALQSTELLPGKSVLNTLFKELSIFNDVFVLRLSIVQPDKAPIYLCTSVRQLERLSLLGAFIQLGQAHNTLQVWHYRLQTLSEEDKETARLLQDLPPALNKQAAALSHVMYIRQVNAALGRFKFSKAPPKPRFPREFMDNDTHWPLHFLMDSRLDRRKEPRFRIEKDAQVKLSLMTNYPAVVCDFSLSGLHLQVLDCNEAEFPQEVKISVPEFKIKSQRYKVLAYNAKTGSLRLSLDLRNDKDKPGSQTARELISQKNIENVVAQQEVLFRYLWELCARSQPSTAIQIVTGRQMVHRLKTVYLPEHGKDLLPFAPAGQQVLTHGFFADMDKSPPDSSVLRRLLQQAKRYALTLHCERKADNRLINLTPEQCFASALRGKLCLSLQQKELLFYATQIENQKIHAETTPMTKQRLALLSKLDIDIYEKLLTLQQNYSNVLHLIDVAALYNSLMLADIVPEIKAVHSE